jgi:hypothetical protein
VSHGTIATQSTLGNRLRPAERAMLDELLEQKIVIDLVSPYVCLGKLVRYDEHWLELKNADFHDLRDTDTTRELYVADSVATGIKRNRKRLFLRRSEVVAISKLEDVVDE